MPIEVFSRVKDGQLNVVNENRNYCKIKFQGKKKESEFIINKLWKMNTQNEEIFQYLLEKSQQYNDSYWCTFGYTGSGKTYTTDGILKLLLEYYSKQLFKIEISAFQIYNEKVYDLLQDNKELKVWKTDHLHLDNLEKSTITNIDSVLFKMKENRNQTSTEMNLQSSRSHAFYKIYIGTKTVTLVDMAGQENGNTNMKNRNSVQKEGTKINLNMLVVKECIRAMHQKKSFIPFRRCLLTLALKPMFYSRCYCAFICTVSNNHNKFYQMDSIRFASALYKQDNGEMDKLYFNLFEDYNKYLNTMGNITFDEHDQWKNMKHGNFKKCNKIREIINYKIRKIKEFNSKYLIYKEKLPEL